MRLDDTPELWPGEEDLDHDPAPRRSRGVRLAALIVALAMVFMTVAVLVVQTLSGIPL